MATPSPVSPMIMPLRRVGELPQSRWGREFARGLVNYNSTQTAQLAGKQTKDIDKILGYRDYDEIIHRDNLVLLD